MSVADEVGCDAGVAGLVPAITAPPPRDPVPRRVRPRGGARKKRARAAQAAQNAPSGVYSPNDFSVWGSLDPRTRRRDAGESELPMRSDLLKKCVLVISDTSVCVSNFGPVGVLCTPRRELLLWWISLDSVDVIDTTQHSKWLYNTSLTIPTHNRTCLVSGKSMRFGHRLPQGGTSGVGFGE